MKNKLTPEAISDYIAEYSKNHETFDVHFVVNKKPEPYARARAGRNGFYNPKSDKKLLYRQLCMSQLTQEQYDKLKKLMSNDDSIYYVHYDCNFYVPIPKSDKEITKELKRQNIIRPNLRNGDIDNYVKFMLDALHEVLYTDDKIVIDVKANKFYSDTPRSEINATIEVYKY